VLVYFSNLSVQLFDPLLLFESCFWIDLPPEKFLLAHQLLAILEPSRVQRSRGQRRSHRTIGFRFMTAIAESAPCRQRIDIRKSLRQPFLRIS
jgi:hypothetical protein